jgi:hypothetical protein
MRDCARAPGAMLGGRRTRLSRRRSRRPDRPSCQGAQGRPVPRAARSGALLATATRRQAARPAHPRDRHHRQVDHRHDPRGADQPACSDRTPLIGPRLGGWDRVQRASPSGLSAQSGSVKFRDDVRRALSSRRGKRRTSCCSAHSSRVAGPAQRRRRELDRLVARRGTHAIDRDARPHKTGDLVRALAGEPDATSRRRSAFVAVVPPLLGGAALVWQFGGPAQCHCDPQSGPRSGRRP